MFGASSELASVLEFGFYRATQSLTKATWNLIDVGVVEVRVTWRRGHVTSRSGSRDVGHRCRRHEALSWSSSTNDVTLSRTLRPYGQTQSCRRIVSFSTTRNRQSLSAPVLGLGIITSGYATMVHGRGCNPHRSTTTFAISILNPNYDVIDDVIYGFAKVVVERCGLHPRPWTIVA